jgi:hypothetical protein
MSIRIKTYPILIFFTVHGTPAQLSNAALLSLLICAKKYIGPLPKSLVHPEPWFQMKTWFLCVSNGKCIVQKYIQIQTY